MMQKFLAFFSEHILPKNNNSDIKYLGFYSTLKKEKRNIRSFLSHIFFQKTKIQNNGVLLQIEKESVLETNTTILKVFVKNTGIIPNNIIYQFKILTLYNNNKHQYFFYVKVRID